MPNPKVANLQMDFYDALRSIASGSKVTRIDWGNQDLYGVLRDGKLTLNLHDGFHAWIVSDGDMVAKDWVVVMDSSSVLVS